MTDKTEPGQTMIDIEKDKQKKSILNLNTILDKHESAKKILQIQLTQTLMDISNLQTEIEDEAQQYWMKELPIQKMILTHLKNMSNLINLYTQQEDLFNKTVEQISDSIQPPSFSKLEKGYLKKIEGLKEEIESIKEETSERMKQYEKDIQERQELEILKARKELHERYDEFFAAARDKIKRLEKLAGGSSHDGDEVSQNDKNDGVILKTDSGTEKNGAVLDSGSSGKRENDTLELKKNKRFSKFLEEKRKKEKRTNYLDLTDCQRDILDLVDVGYLYNIIRNKISSRYNKNKFYQDLKKLRQKKIVKKTKKKVDDKYVKYLKKGKNYDKYQFEGENHEKG